VIIHNAGRGPAPAFTLRLQLGRRTLATTRVRGLRARRGARRVLRFTLPTIAPGRYRLTACALLRERRRANNCRSVIVALLAAPAGTTAPNQSGTPSGPGGGSAPAPQQPAPGPPAMWLPAPRTTWQIQLNSGDVDTSVDAQYYDVDMVETPQSTIDSLHAQGRHVSCYFSAGTYEPFRPDASSFPEDVKGKPLAPPFQDERWLDIRRLDELGPIMRARMDRCKSKRFDAVDTDNVDGYTNDTGFPLTAADQLRYNRFLAAEAHARNLSIGLKNDLEQIPDLVGDFDFEINESCFDFNECDRLTPFVRAGKPVFQIEYNKQRPQFCPQANAMGFMAVLKHIELDAFREACWEPF